MSEPEAQSESLVSEFCEEAMDLIEGAAESLSDYSRNPENAEAINQVFRAVHTIKGNAGFFRLPAVKNFAHSLEDALDEVRQGSVQMSDELSRLLVEGIDVLGEMVSEIQDGAEDATATEQHAELLSRVKSLCESELSNSEEARLLAELRSLADEISGAQVAQSEQWASRLRELTIDSSGNKEDSQNQSPEDIEEITPLALQEASFQHDGVDITQQAASLVTLFTLVEEGRYRSEDGQAFLDASLAFAAWAEECQLNDLAARVKEAREDFGTIFHSPLDMDPFLLSVVWQKLGPALSDLQLKPTHEDAAGTTNTVVQKEEPAPKQEEPEQAAKKRMLRVREERVDDFLEDVSNLFITCERLKDLQLRMVAQLQTHALVDELRQINATLAGQSTVLQRSVVELRKVPVRGLFSKFPRVARTLATKLGKQLDVHLDGEDIEIDKSLLDDLDGPLMHMVRNVCDHGIEEPKEREGRGVAPTGNLWISCSLTNTHVVVTVKDDGRGIDPDRLRRKGSERGIGSPEEMSALSDQEAVELIFHPGLSTAEQVSEVSGRGVGLDVVRTQVRGHDGDVKVSSILGQGTEFRLEIPIRKAVVVVDGLLVRQGETTFAIPFDFIKEILSIESKSVSTVQGRPVVRVRGEPYPAVPLEEVLQIEGGAAHEAETKEGVLIEGNEKSMLLLVDSVVGHRKLVISDLGEVLDISECLGGVVQLGGGRLALVLNPEELVRCAWRNPVSV